MDRRVTLRGSARSYTLLHDTNAQCRIEAATGLPYPTVLDAIQHGNVTVLRQWLHGGLIDPPDQTLEQAGAIVDDIGGVDVFQAATKRSKRKRARG